MSRRKIGQEELAINGIGQARRSSLDELTNLIDWAPVAQQLDGIHSAKKGEPAWPPLALFKVPLIAMWHDVSDVKLTEALDDRALFRRFCGSKGRGEAGCTGCEIPRVRTAIAASRPECMIGHGKY